MDAEEASRQTFTTIHSTALAKGWTKSAFWLKLDIQPKVSAHTRYLTVVPANFSTSKIFIHENGNWSEINKKNPAQDLNIFVKKINTFKIPAGIDADAVLVRIEASRIVLGQFWIEGETELISNAISLSQRLIFYLGLVFFLNFYFLWNGIIKRDLFFLSTVIYGLEITVFRILVAGGTIPFDLIKAEALTDLITVVALPLTFSIYFYSLIIEHKIQGVIKSISKISIYLWAFLFILYFINANAEIFNYSPYAALMEYSLLLIYPLIKRIRKKIGLLLSISIFSLGMMMVTYRMFTMGLMPNSFDNLMTTSIHLPFFVLLSVTGISAIRSRKLEQQERQRLEIQAVIEETEKHKYQEEQQRKFMLMLTHELKNGLSVLRLYLQADIRQMHNLNKLADQSINDMDSILDRCSEVDHLDRNQIMLNYQPLLITDLISALIEKNTHKERIYFASHIAPLKINTDQVLLKTILGNLLDNALKYSPSDSAITISITEETCDDSAQIERHKNMLSICINNALLPSDRPDPEAIFKKYYRGPKSYRTTGSGLGLYITKSMTELIGGNISYTENHDIVTMKLCIPI